MHARKSTLERDFDLSTLSPSSLNGLYDQTVEGLRRYSQILPGDVSDETHADEMEASLMEIEMSVLEQASQIPLKTSADVNSLIDLWGKASEIQMSSDIRPTDRIVMNIFRHLAEKLA